MLINGCEVIAFPDISHRWQLCLEPCIGDRTPGKILSVWVQWAELAPMLGDSQRLH
jgi:hypothetical protein